jgi:hypothetical protein
MAFTPTITKTWRYTTAKTNEKLEDVGATQRMVPVDVSVTAAGSNTGDVSVTLGLHPTTLPTMTTDSATGAAGVFFSHPGVPAGLGAVKAKDLGLALGDVDADLRGTWSAATGGFIDITVQYRMLEDQ